MAGRPLMETERTRQFGVERLALQEVRAHFLAEQSGTLPAPNPLLLLEQPDVDLGPIVSAEPQRFESDIEGVIQKLNLGLYRSGVPADTRLAVTAEVGHLARFTGSLAIERRLRLEIGSLAGLRDSFETAGDDEDEIVAVAQILRKESPRLETESYRRALAEPDAIYRSFQGEALVAWGERRQALDDLRQRLDGSGSGDELLVLLTATREATSRDGRRALGSFPELPVELCRSSVPIVLVTAPFGPLDYPCLGLSTLKETVEEPKPLILYLTIPFAESIGHAFYDWISASHISHRHLLGDWIFGHALGGARPRARYLEETLCESTLGWLDRSWDEAEPPELVPFSALVEFLDAIELAEASLEVWASKIIAMEPRIVGFTSLFQQNAASLALAKRLKEEHPEISTVFGGANWEGEMGVALRRSYSFVDVAVSGEAELVFPQLVAGLSNGGSRPDPLDLLPLEKAPRPDMSQVPRPDFEDFFAQWRQSQIEGAVRRVLLFESSRGCWWGAKSHCTFCGLNGESMVFRSKSPDRVLEEIAWLVERYPGEEIAAVDNILSMDYFATVLSELAERKLPLSLFYEVKANLNKGHLALLKRAGVDHIQPGIESLSDNVLGLMAKGVTGLQNIQLLKWCSEYGIVPHWNLIWGFPGETPEDYELMSRDIPLLTHLAPPVGAGSIRLDRFSPNHSDPEGHGFTNVRPAKAYAFVYEGLAEDELGNVAYCFDYDYLNGRSPRLTKGAQRLWMSVEAWRSEHESSRLMHVATSDGMLVFDSRSCATEQVHLLEGDTRRVFEVCESIQTMAGLESRMGGANAHAALEELTARRLLVRSGNRVLNPSLCAEITADA